MKINIDKRAVKFKSHRGYTLIELIVVMVILLTVGGLVVGIIASVLRSSTKTKIINDIAQNGNYALSVVTNVLINSQKFESFNSTSPVSGVLGRCDMDPNSGILGPFTGSKVTVLGLDGGITELTCTPSGTISSNSASLTDLSQVRMTSCQFKCIQSSLYSPPRIDVSFNLSNVSGQTVESLGQSTFNTSVSLRNSTLR